jgi:hypothetical protein
MSEQHVIDENTFLRNNISSPNRYEAAPPDSAKISSTGTQRKINHAFSNITPSSAGGYEADLEPPKPKINNSYHISSKMLLPSTATNSLQSPEVTLPHLMIDL